MSNIKWHKCGVVDCKYKAKLMSTLKKHQQGVHNIDVVWHRCDQEGYEYKAKHTIKKHKQNVHNIDVKWHRCDQEGCEYKTKE